MHDRTLIVARFALRALAILNVIAIGAFVAGILASFPMASVILARLAPKYHDQPLEPILDGMRTMLGIGVLAGIAAHVIFTRMLAILATARAGDPFVVANARRLQAMGCALLAIQLLDLSYGALIGWFRSHHVETPGWAPSIGGWIAVLMLFVLARVFRLGAAMREELAMTV